MSLTDKMRDVAIREVGCICCLRMGKGYVPAEKHHLLSTGRHGSGKRRGEQFTIGLCIWHHRGQPMDGWSPDSLEQMLGPSYGERPRAFRAKFGTDDELLAEQDRLIAIWRDSIIGAVA